MRLEQFILANIPAISREWEVFAATLVPKEEFSRSVLRDGIEDLLAGIAADMRQSQTAEQQRDKAESEGKSSKGLDGVAQTHASERVGMGVSSQQLISEFRALRASVIRLWRSTTRGGDERDIYDLTRFNEAIDQSITEAEKEYRRRVDNSRELFLGILGHDLRNPLAAISALAESLLRAKDIDRNVTLANKISGSARRMSYMITDLMELARLQSGREIAVRPTNADVREICLQVIGEMEGIHPGQPFKLNAEHGISGNLDIPKISQVLSNLVGNAVQHGASGSAITITAGKVGSGIELRVHNEGPSIPPSTLPKIFDCFVQGKSGLKSDEDQSSSLGLGLYIAREIVVAHGGTIEVHSSESDGTTFVVRLPIAAEGNCSAPVT